MASSVSGPACFRITPSGYINRMNDRNVTELLGYLEAAGLEYEIVDRCSDARCVICSLKPIADAA